MERITKGFCSLQLLDAFIYLFFPNRTRDHMVMFVLMLELYHNFKFPQFCSVVTEVFIKAMPPQT